MKINKYFTNVQPGANAPASRSLSGELKSPLSIPKPSRAVDKTPVYEALQQSANNLFSIGDKIDKAVASEQYDTAVLEANKQYADLQNDILTNPNWKKLSYDEADAEYLKRATSIHEGIVENTKHPLAKKELNNALGKLELVNRDEARKTSWKHNILRMKASVDNGLNDYLMLAQNATSDKQLLTYIEEGNKLVYSKVGTVFGSKEEADIIASKYNDTIYSNYYQRYMYGNIANGADYEDSYKSIVGMLESNEALYPNTRISLLNKAQSEYEQRVRAEDRLKDENKWKAREAAEDNIARAYVGGEPTYEPYINSVLDEGEQHSYKEKLEVANKVFSLGKNIETNPILHGSAILAKIKEEVKTGNADVNLRVYNALEEKYNGVIKLINKDMAGWAVKYGGAQADNPNSIVFTLDRQGIPKHRMNIVQNPDTVVEDMHNMSPKDASEQMKKFNSFYGKYSDIAWKDLSEHKLSVGLSLCATIENDNIREKAITWVRVKESAIKDIVSNEDRKVIESQIEEDIQPHIASYMRENPAYATQTTELKLNITKLAIGLYTEGGFTKIEDAVEKAFNLTVNSSYTIDGFLRIPKTVDESKVSKAKDLIINKLSELLKDDGYSYDAIRLMQEKGDFRNYKGDYGMVFVAPPAIGDIEGHNVIVVPFDNSFLDDFIAGLEELEVKEPAKPPLTEETPYSDNAIENLKRELEQQEQTPGLSNEEIDIFWEKLKGRHKQGIDAMRKLYKRK